jgi:glycosyltransferase involved in cell wall biosynthesis
MNPSSVRIVHALGWYFPDSVGGTERYVTGLAQELRGFDVQSSICAPLTGHAARSYVHDGCPVFRYPVHPEFTADQLNGSAPHGGFEQFQDWLRQERPDVFHQHSWTTGCGGFHLHHARALGLKTVLTLHLPGIICARGSMLEMGRRACDGQVRCVRCGACIMQSHGVPAPIASLTAGLLNGVLARPLRPLAPARLLNALALPEQRLVDIARIIEDCDRVVAVCQWLYDALVANGIPSEKLSLNRHGLTDAPPVSSSRPASNKTDRGVLRIVYLGRTEPVKGLEFLLRALRAIPLDVPVQLTLHATPASSFDQDYQAQVLALCEGDTRLRFAGALPPERVYEVLRQHDVIAIPSQWLETGPLVALEALSQGLWVMGSRLGGLTEIIEDGVNGQLLPHNDVGAWTRAIIALAWQESVPSAATRVRTMRDVARDMHALYQDF